MDTYRDVGWTSSREGLTARQEDIAQVILLALRERGATHFHHGDCVGGDVEGARIAAAQGYVLISHPPIVDTLRAYIPSFYVCTPFPYLIRNGAIIASSDVVIGCPKSEHPDRSGTWATLRYARNGKTDYIAIRPSGEIVQRGCDWIEVPS